MPAIIVDPALQAAVIRQFNLRGELAPFNLTENVVPVFDIGSLTGNLPTVVTTLAGFQGVRVGTLSRNTALIEAPVEINDTDIVDSGVVVNPAALQVLVDTGAFPALNNRLIECHISATVIADFRIEWRNAANAANLATWSTFADAHGYMLGPWNLRFAMSERIRIISIAAVVGSVTAVISSPILGTSLAS